MFLLQGTFRTILVVSAVLILAFVATGFASSAYHREKQLLGEEHYKEGQQLAARGETEAAAEEYRKALLFSPEETNYRLSLATALIDAGRLDEAQSHLEQLLQEDPTNGLINLLLARVALQRNQLKMAKDYYQRAVYEYWPASESTERRKARWELVNLLSRTGQRNAVIAELIQLYANAPGDQQQKAKIGFLLLDNGAVSEAAQVFRDLVKQAPQDTMAHFGLGQVYFSSGDFVSARHEFERAARLSPHDPRTEQALALTNDVIDLDPVLPSITATEQLRRSQNLLSRVIKDLQACPGFQHRLDAAQKLLATKPQSKEDLSLRLHQAAQSLWHDKGLFCGSKPVNDRTLDTVLSRMNQ
ncbi:MAG: tetratricopeptide repeat protein [Acidobacteriaceae bacterium]|nr:tetratricopeptide repeat protein [Acidobacteriaceae bacterium]